MARTRSAPPVDPLPASPAARRSGTPRWLDLRLLLGLALVAAAVVGGARIVSAADKTVKVWAVTADLAAGTTLTESDLTTVDVRLDEHATSYLAASADPVGKTLSRDVGKGDLLPAKAITGVEDIVSLALSVPAAHVPVTVARGDRVTLYATGENPGSGEQSASALVVAAVTVADVSERSQGALSVGTGELQVVIKVPSCAVSAILDGTAEKVLTVVELPAGAAAEPIC